ncbi:MAG: hypothetical protein CMLOHMNK_01483 [Steroidobacteraceae bacterium]|nr:hypothetical protein [Steroidobacteraceae bacterium]
MKNTVALLIACCAIGACDRGRWIELPPMLMTCSDLEDKDMRAELANPDKFSIGRGMLQGVCAQSGAGQFTGDTRCNKKAVEIRCKS